VRVEVCACTSHVMDAHFVVTAYSLGANHAGDSALCAGSGLQLLILIRDRRKSFSCKCNALNLLDCPLV
jgi:hypothetical protein